MSTATNFVVDQADRLVNYALTAPCIGLNNSETTRFFELVDQYRSAPNKTIFAELLQEFSMLTSRDRFKE